MVWVGTETGATQPTPNAMFAPSTLPSQVITYSPAFTLVPTYECFNRCTYCNFRVNPGQDSWLEVEQARAILTALAPQSVVEILILCGEVHPHSPRRAAWVQRIYDLCALALDLGFLPHTNAGPLSVEEMAYLHDVNVSMGLMLEQITPALTQTVHRHAPSKIPGQRLQQLYQAGELRIPFTTGLLLGIGECEADRVETLGAIATVHHQYRHIQEVILQPHQPGQQQLLRGSPCSEEDLIRTIELARNILPDDITLQIPPNLLPEPTQVLDCLTAGARDLGGIGPVDEVNPTYPHSPHATLKAILAQANWQLIPRLPLYPQYDTWLSPTLQAAVSHWRKRLQPNPPQSSVQLTP